MMVRCRKTLSNVGVPPFEVRPAPTELSVRSLYCTVLSWDVVVPPIHAGLVTRCSGIAGARERLKEDENPLELGRVTWIVVMK